jgi:hypothetical protein
MHIFEFIRIFSFPVDINSHSRPRQGSLIPLILLSRSINSSCLLADVELIQRSSFMLLGKKFLILWTGVCH